MDPRDRQRWLRAASVVAAYRDRYDIDSSSALGAESGTDAQRLDAARARQAIRRAAAIADEWSDPRAMKAVAADGPAIR